MTQKELLRVIHAKCLDCVYEELEVRLCPCTDCPLHPFRMGQMPDHMKKPRTEAQIAAQAKAVAARKLSDSE